MCIDNVVKSYFNKNADESLQSKIIKLKDVSESRNAKQMTSAPDLKTISASKKLKDFYSGKRTIRDHQGVRITNRGERLDSIHKAYEE